MIYVLTWMMCSDSAAIVAVFFSWFNLSQEAPADHGRGQELQKQREVDQIETRLDQCHCSTYYLLTVLTHLVPAVDLRVCGGLVRVLDRWWSSSRFNPRFNCLVDRIQ